MQKLFVAALLSLACARARDVCAPLNSALAAKSKDAACSCFAPADAAWIGCTLGDMPDILAALLAVDNPTDVSKLWIWDSFIPVVPKDLFANVRPKVLVIERSGVGIFRDDACLAPMAERLEELQLKNNILTSVNERVFQNLTRLRRLDLSDNKLASVDKDSFGSLASLTTLILARNVIESIDDNSFVGMPNLSHLNLAGNRITRTSSLAFAGLRNLQRLNLEDNRLTVIEAGAFVHPRQLESLNLASNLLSAVSLGEQRFLQTLICSNNTISSFAHVQLTSAESLLSLQLDNNRVQRVGADDFAPMRRLQTLSLARNRIASIEPGSFSAFPYLQTLALQNNRLSEITSGVFNDLVALQRLFLSENRLNGTIGERTLRGLQQLQMLALSRNAISDVHRRAFSSLLSLERLYLDENQLNWLANGTLAHLNERRLRAVDLSGNPWVCDCALSWLIGWLRRRSDVVLGAERTRCGGDGMSLLSARLSPPADCATRRPDGDDHSLWITAIGVVLGAVSLLILAAIALLYVQDARALHAAVTARPPSDMVTLIGSSAPTEKRVRFDNA